MPTESEMSQNPEKFLPSAKAVTATQRSSNSSSLDDSIIPSTCGESSTNMRSSAFGSVKSNPVNRFPKPSVRIVNRPSHTGYSGKLSCSVASFANKAAATGQLNTQQAVTTSTSINQHKSNVRIGNNFLPRTSSFRKTLSFDHETKGLQNSRTHSGHTDSPIRRNRQRHSS